MRISRQYSGKRAQSGANRDAKLEANMTDLGGTKKLKTRIRYFKWE